ncbi:MAG: ABC transporter permease [Winogradskyella sp.]|uniref:ABC transporter permease n=1 Tax=Winogradskyella sp. TaxID=1883156 RepID=UPI0025E6D9EE|nr:ABC transporter permease [Winogradskyella sp.]NRB61281.1 ABC transporter permease [Winogradskyella sp.]
MFKNYLKIAFRNLIKNNVYSFINISGLAIGMAAAMLIALWIYDELSYDSYSRDKAYIAQVYQSETYNGIVDTGAAIPRPLEFALREDYADNFEHIIMSSWNEALNLSYEDINLTFSGNFMQSGAPDLLELEFLDGDENSLEKLNAIMIAQSTAKALFGDEPAIGKTISINNYFNLNVSAVYKDLPNNSSFSSVEFIIPWEALIAASDWHKRVRDNWGNNSFQLYVKINPNTTMEAVTQKILNVKKDRSKDEAEFNPQIFLFPMEDWYLRNNWDNGVQTGGRIENLWMFGIIGVFILLLACINFVNLSTARSAKRAIEVGIRKSIGSQRRQLIFQFLSESFAIVVLSFVLAIGIVLLFLNGFNALASKSIVFPWSNLTFWLSALVFIVIMTILSGSYPAMYLSSFNPVKVLKGAFKVGKNSSLPRKILVVTQFSISVALIIGTLVVIDQIQFSKDRPVGYDKEGLIEVFTLSDEFDGKQDLMREQFINSGGVVSMTTMSSPTTDVFSNISGYNWEGKPEGFQEDFAFISVHYDFVKTLGLNVIDGRAFSRGFATDSSGVILNKTAVDYMKIQDPIGKYIRHNNPSTNVKPYKIIGVIEDMVVTSPYSKVKQAMYVFDTQSSMNFYSLRLNPKNSISENLLLIESTFKKNFPNTPFNYQFADEEYGKKFRAEERIASLAQVFSALAIFISCLGLFGLASFVAEQRTKEIGVRKVLGASVGQLWLLLSKDFITLVTIALAIASPLAYYVMSRWLQKFTYRSPLGWDVFVIACFGAIIITLITVSFQAIKAATTNPVKSLRTE